MKMQYKLLKLNILASWRQTFTSYIKNNENKIEFQKGFWLKTVTVIKIILCTCCPHKNSKFGTIYLIVGIFIRFI